MSEDRFHRNLHASRGALIPALERPEEASALFVNQMTTAIGTYLVQRYGGRPNAAPGRAGTLSRAHEVLAKGIFLENREGDISISDVAQACNLSQTSDKNHLS